MKLTILLALALTACAPQEKGLDVIEVRTWAGAKLFQDRALGQRVTNPVLVLVKDARSITPVTETNQSDTAVSFRITFLEDEVAGPHRVLTAILYPRERIIFFRARKEEKWKRGLMREATLEAELKSLDRALGSDLSAAAALTDPQFDAVRRAVLAVSTAEGIFPEDIRFVSIADVIWPDTSLGFPKPDMMYAQVLTPGHRILLALPNGTTIEVHTSATAVATAAE